MGDRASSSNARSLRAQLEGLNRAQQHEVAYHWAVANGKLIDLLGDFAKQRQLLLFQSGNESENWLDPVLNIVYKMNMLVHVGEDLAKLFDRIEAYNRLFPTTALRFIGFQAMSSSNVYPIFIQPFVPNARFATDTEIAEYMQSIGFKPTSKEGEYENEQYIVSDLKPKNVICNASNDVFVIDAEVQAK